MKKSRVFFIAVMFGVLTVSLVISAFWAGSASAATGCFNDTNGHWAETFICWMKDNNITTGIGGGNYGPDQVVTRAQMAVFMQRASNVPPSTGLITIAGGLGNWKPFASSDNLSFSYYSGSTYVQKASTGQNFLSLHPSVPTVLYGRQLELVGVEFCYQTSAGAYLSYVEINTPLHTSAPGTQVLRFSDGTDRTDTACRYYTLSTPAALTAENEVNIFIGVQWVTANANFVIGRTTFVLQPTGTVAVAPSALSDDVVILSESTNDDTLPDTSAP